MTSMAMRATSPTFELGHLNDLNGDVAVPKPPPEASSSTNQKPRKKDRKYNTETDKNCHIGPELTLLGWTKIP